MKTGLKRSFLSIVGLSLVFMGLNAYAQAAATNISGMAGMIQSTLTPLINLVVASCYLGGAGFCAGAIFKFKAHKDNPTQVPIGTPIMLLFVGAGLLFLPSIINMMANSFGLSGTSQAFNFTGGSIVP